jgi:hypothetical protein
MHAENLISDFEKDASTVIKAAITCQEATMPFVPYFPPFLSTYAASARIPSSLDIKDDDDESDQGYSDEDQPMSPKLYDLDEPPTPTTEHQPTQLAAYKNDPHGGFRPPSDWPGVPITPLLEITPNPEPWPYLPEQYHSPIPTGALSYSLESLPALPRKPLLSPPHPDTPPSLIHPSIDPSLSPMC